MGKIGPSERGRCPSFRKSRRSAAVWGRVSLTNLRDLAPGVEVAAILHHADDKVDTIRLKHGLNNEQIAWFRAGSALNLLRRQEGSGTQVAPPPA